MSQTSLYKKLKPNGTSLYVFPSVEEDKNFESQNENYKMYLSHYVLVNFPKQVLTQTLDFDNTFEQNNTSITPPSFKDQLVESLRNYVANHDVVIRNSKINQSTFYYDTFETHTTTEKIFWKWAKKLGIINFEPADTNQDYFGSDTKYDNNGPSGNIDHYREYLWRERTNIIYDITNTQDLGASVIGLVGFTPDTVNASPGTQLCQITLTASTNFKPGDDILINLPGYDLTPYSATQSLVKIVSVGQNPINDEILVEISLTAPLSSNLIGNELTIYYNRFVQYICEVGGLNNVQLPDKAYTETYAYISHQHGQIPYSLWNIHSDNNYKPNSQFPILPIEIQAEIQGGENPNNPILITPSLYPGDIWGHFDNASFLYETQPGDIIRRHGDYYGNNAITNVNPSLKYPEYNGDLIDGLVLNLNINDYAQAVSYIYPIESFNEFCATSFNNIAPKDFEFNAILWYYTIEDVTGNTIEKATNLYGIEFLENSENDALFAKTKIPSTKKLVSNGYQDGNSYTFSLDINIAIDSNTPTPTFDPDKVYSLYGMELFYEALTRITYFNDQITNYVNSNLTLTKKVEDLTGLVYNQQTLESIRRRMDNIEKLLNVYSTLQIGNTDTIVPRLDTSVTPPLLRLDSIDKQYGYIYEYETKSLFNEFVNINSLTEITITEKTIPVVNGKDFLVIVSNNDNSIPTPTYDTTIEFNNLSLVIEQDLFYKQKMDLFILPKINTDLISPTNILNEPINDKKINLFINYNDGNTIIKQQLGKFNLPVLKYYDGASSYNFESHVGLNYVPVWKIERVMYSKPNTNERVFTFIIEDDLVNKLQDNSRIYIDNFFIEEDPLVPSGSFIDLSGQYELNNPDYVRSNIVDVELLNGGTTGYANGPIIETGLIHSNSGSYTADIEYTAVGGIINNVKLINTTGVTNKNINNLISSIPVPGGTGALIKFIAKNVCKIEITFDINLNANLNTILSAYDSITNINTLPANVTVNIDQFLKINPVLTLLKGYKVSMVRISQDDLPITLIDQRYQIKIERL